MFEYCCKNTVTPKSCVGPAMQGLHGASQDLYWALKSRLSSVRSLQNRYLVYMAAILLNEQKLQCQSLRHFQQFLMCSSLVIKATVHFSKLTWLLPKSRTKVGAHGSVRACLHPRMAREVPGPGDTHVTHWHKKCHCHWEMVQQLPHSFSVSVAITFSHV